jgi:nicotinamidase-related amidase
MASITSNYTESRCSMDNAALLLIDHQTGTMQLNHDPTPVEFRQAVIALAKVGKIFKLPTVITRTTRPTPMAPSCRRSSISIRTRRSSAVLARSAPGTMRTLWPQRRPLAART